LEWANNYKQSVRKDQELMKIKELEWKDVDWASVQRRVSRQQRRVYKASMEGNRAKVHAIQRRIIGSLDSKLLAVRQVTTENKGHHTIGVDEQKAIFHQKKMELVRKLKLDGKARRIRRAYIPKPGKDKYPPLGIPTIKDRAKQMLVKLALEPEWEAIFEPNSYGFRPGRSCQDAIGALLLSLRGKSRYVLEADIQKCFDTIDHDQLLQKLNTFELMESQIRAWLKADIMEGYLNHPSVVFQSMEGTPQSDVISPLLANIALHGLEEYIKNWYTDLWYSTAGQPSKVVKRDRRNSIGVVRYADDFVITAPSLEDVVALKHQVGTWLENETGLSLSKAKTRIVNATEGFEFLGFKLISLKSNGTYRLKIYPSRSSQARLLQRLRTLVQTNRSASSFNLILLLSPRIIRWANYFRFSECSEVFSKMDYTIFEMIRAWVFRRKSKGLRSRTALKEKYFPTGKTYRFQGKTYTNNWILTGKSKHKLSEQENFLPKMAWVDSGQHIKVKGKASPYDGNHLYWALRTEQYSGYNHRISKLLKI